jgi:hypothetical protein
MWGCVLVEDEPCVYEIQIHGCPSIEEALALQTPIARVLCPDEWHEPPCEVPWTFTFCDNEGQNNAVVLILGIYAFSGQATELAEQVRAVAGETRSVVLGEGAPERFEALVEQYRIENESRSSH